MFIEPEGRGEAGGQGDVSAALRRALALEGPPLPKAHLLGTHRAAEVAEMLARVAPHLAPCGIARVSRITGFDRTGLEVFTVARPNARGLSVANGKGLDRATARLSGVMEALERWHAEHVLLPLRFGTAEDVAALGAPVVVAGLPRARTGDPGLTFWAPALDVAAGTPARVPFELVHCAWVAAGPAPGVFEATTDGLASGSHPVEAALHGLCELIETDACALFEGLPPRRGRRAGSIRRRSTTPGCGSCAGGWRHRALPWRSGMRRATSAPPSCWPCWWTSATRARPRASGPAAIPTVRSRPSGRSARRRRPG